ncbi:MAG: hypothetical protein COT45_04575 [bacterium (Candidatus Stahlbacteria) CG08_land_8_20_14_0_20_40_26]|nr:MAG: hypothetical protein COT45_04575 [bacterium (Candidatus Stahlbacteria) CG08_land_8_20_14_0_20_40_26]
MSRKFIGTVNRGLWVFFQRPLEKCLTTGKSCDIIRSERTRKKGKSISNAKLAISNEKLINWFVRRDDG